MAQPDDPDDTDSTDGNGPTSEVVRFPQSRVSPPGAQKPFKDLGPSRFANLFGALERPTTGHWCSHCRGIWFGYPLEVACPVCGNRRG